MSEIKMIECYCCNHCDDEEYIKVIDGKNVCYDCQNDNDTVKTCDWCNDQSLDDSFFHDINDETVCDVCRDKERENSCSKMNLYMCSW